MRSFSISELERLSGIQAHTLRTWEKRFAIVSPVRKGRLRQYSIDELQTILFLSILNKSGFKISHLVKLSNDDLTKAIDEVRHDEVRKFRTVCRLILSMHRLDVDGFEQLLDDSFLGWPSDVVVGEIIYPFLEKVGLLFQGSRRNEEHLVATAVRKKLFWCIEKADQGYHAQKTILLFLPDQRHLDLSLLYVHYLFKRKGWRVLYMGNNVSEKNLEELLSVKETDYLFTYTSRQSLFPSDGISVTLRRLQPETVLLIASEAGSQTQKSGNLWRMSLEAALQLLSALN